MRIVMMGTGSFAQPTFEALLASAHEIVGLVTQPDRATGDERSSTRQTGRGIKEIARERGLPVLQPESINTPEGIAALGAWKPDLLVVAAYGQILSNDLLGAAPKGGINVHASLLPKYRGAAPVAWAIWNGESESGVTIIRMSVALDAGDILAQESIPIEPEETAGHLESRLAGIGARLALATVERLASGNVQGVPQDKAKATKAPKLKKEHGLVDWTQSARRVCNQIRALQPWPTAYTFLHRADKPPLRLLVWQASVAKEATLSVQKPRAGAIHFLPGETRFYVETGTGERVEILEVQPSGKRRMNASQFLRGNPLESGWRFGGEKA